MSKVLGIIAEYNPFHNGHLYHLQKAKEITNSDYTVAIISGNFTQRGSTSLIDKWSKTEMALLNGVDLVIEHILQLFEEALQVPKILLMVPLKY